MFSAIFGKRKSSPVEDETPPIPGPRPEDGFEIISPTSSIYPSVTGGTVPLAPFPQRPAPAIPRMNSVEQNFHYLQGVPFTLCRELKMASNKDGFTTEIGDLLAYLTNKLNMDEYNYDFSLEKSVLKEY